MHQNRFKTAPKPSRSDCSFNSTGDAGTPLRRGRHVRDEVVPRATRVAAAVVWLLAAAGTFLWATAIAGGIDLRTLLAPLTRG
jgi:hypothetical protein